MPPYTYVARNRLGRVDKGTLEAPNSEEAVSILQGRDLIVISCNESRTKTPTLGGWRGYHRGVRNSDLVTFARSLAAMTEAGLPLLRSMEVLEEQTRSRRLSTAIGEMLRDIRGGSTFRDAMARHPKVFSPFWVSLVETGEASGHLTKALEQIGSHLEKAGSVRRKVVTAMIYPCILIAVAIGAILVFTLKIIPTFASLYANLGGRLPGLTLVVMAFSNLLRRFFPIFLAVAVALGFLFRWYLHTEKGRWQFDRLKLGLPILGPLFQSVAVEEFGSNLGTLLKAGVPILHALEIVTATCRNTVIASVLENARISVREGRSLAEPFTRTDLFPPMVAQLVSVGEQTGKLSTMLEEIARHYEEQVSTTLERLTSLLEPALLIGMAVVIGTLLISMYLPIFSMGELFRGR